MQLTSSPDCTRCPGVAESAEHAMFECPRFDSTRTELLHGVVPETLLEHMLQSPENWSNVCEATKRITSALQQDWDETRRELAEQGAPRVADNQHNQGNVRTSLYSARNTREEQRGRRHPTPSPPPRAVGRRAEVRSLGERYRRQLLVVEERRRISGHSVGGVISQEDGTLVEASRQGMNGAEETAATEADVPSR